MSRKQLAKAVKAHAPGRSVLRSKTEKAVRAWWAKQGKEQGAYGMYKERVRSVHHIYPRCYIVARVGDRTLVVSHPWTDAEPHLREWVKDRPLDTIGCFDESLQTGDWCSTAYISAGSNGVHVAVPCV